MSLVPFAEEVEDSDWFQTLSECSSLGTEVGTRMEIEKHFSNPAHSFDYNVAQDFDLDTFSYQAVGNSTALALLPIARTQNMELQLYDSNINKRKYYENQNDVICLSIVSCMELSESALDKTNLQQQILIRDSRHYDMMWHHLNPKSQISRMQKIDCYSFMSSPYIKTGRSKTCMAGPAIDPNVVLPFDLRKRSKEWTTSQISRLETCVRKSFFSRKVFFAESRYESTYLTMGFTHDEIRGLEHARRRLDRRLSAVECLPRRSGKNLIRSEDLIQQWLNEDTKLHSEFMISHQKPGQELKPIVVIQKNDSMISAHITVADVIKVRQKELTNIYKDRFNKDIPVNISLVDWMMVSKDMCPYLTRPLSEHQIELFYRLTLSKSYNHGPTTSNEVGRLKHLTKRRKKPNWSVIVNRLKTNRSKIRLFHTYMRHVAPRKNKWLCEDGVKEVRKLVMRYQGNLEKVAAELSKTYGEVSIKSLRSNWRSINPGFAVGRFLPSEDALLFVVLEILGNEFNQQQDFNNVRKYLPWRYCNIWRNRIVTLFGVGCRQWTLEEDKLLLNLYNIKGNQWTRFGRIFRGRSRKAIAARCYRLLEKIKTLTLDEYHKVYSRRKFVEREMSWELKHVAIVLEAAIQDKHNERPKYRGINRKRPVICDFDPMVYAINPPDENQMSVYLRAFSLDILKRTLDRLYSYIGQTTKELAQTQLAITCPSSSQSTQLAICGPADWISSQNNTHSDQPKGMLCDRRKFYRNDPISVASALHLRRVNLVPLEKLCNPSQFEKDVLTYYKIFCYGNPTKKSAKRHGVPEALELYMMPELNRLIVYQDVIPIKMLTTCKVEQDQLVPMMANIPVHRHILEAQKKLESRGAPKPLIRGLARKTKIRIQRGEASKLRWDKERARAKDCPKTEAIEAHEAIQALPPIYAVMNDHTYCKSSFHFQSKVMDDNFDVFCPMASET